MKENYPPGTRLELQSMDDPYTKILPGTRGTVLCVDDIGTIHISYTVRNLAKIKYPYTNQNNAPDEIKTMLMNAIGETYGMVLRM